MELITFILDIIQSIAVTTAAIVAAVTAVIGLFTWRQQLIGRKRIELAEETLTLAYELQGVIEWARNPASFSNEGQGRPGRDQESESRRSRNDAYYSRLSRLAQHEEQFARMRTLRMRFRTFFGDRGQRALCEFSIVRNRIVSAVGMLISTAGESVRNDLIREWEEIIWEGYGNGEDDIKRRIDNAIVELENLCRPILARE